MVVGISLVKDEQDIIGETVAHMLSQVDEILVLDNGSTDGTREILDEMPITVMDDPDPAYYQSAKMTGLANAAREHGASWVVPFDADEIWLGRGGRIADILESLEDWILIAAATLYDHVATAEDPEEPSPVERIRWRRSVPGALPKVACRALHGLTIHQGNHGASYEHTDHAPSVTNLLNIRHLPYRSVEQFIRKIRNGAAAYAATDLPEETGAHWRAYGRMNDEQLAEHFYRWFWRENPRDEIQIGEEMQPPLVLDPCPIFERTP